MNKKSVAPIKAPTGKKLVGAKKTTATPAPLATKKVTKTVIPSKKPIVQESESEEEDSDFEEVSSETPTKKSK